jgi:hypothetical protein
LSIGFANITKKPPGWAAQTVKKGAVFVCENRALTHKKGKTAI